MIGGDGINDESNKTAPPPNLNFLLNKNRQTTGKPRTLPSSADHPRACGANLHAADPAVHSGGSSPRMRGKRAGHRLRPRPYRIIPAHAGQTTATRCPCESPADHPRACGANGGLPMAFSWLTGSSPRMRGKRVEPVCDGAEVRIIPAHAGQTAPNRQDACPCPDHPRACGANRRYGRFSARPVGSSPRMRGKRPVHHRVHADLRIIPAHAGQTSSSPSICQQRPDHPRACGANQAAGLNAGILGGSSPRMRGKHRVHRVRGRGIRIIPAHAGQTSWAASVRYAFADHPRACGANPIPPEKWKGGRGSSPRMRGKPRSSTRRSPTPRIIPAHAGQTSLFSVSSILTSDHPRACGANSPDPAHRVRT